MRFFLALFLTLIFPLSTTFAHTPTQLLLQVRQEIETLEVAWISCEQELTEALAAQQNNKNICEELIAQARQAQATIEEEIEKREILIEELELQAVPQRLNPRARSQSKAPPPDLQRQRATHVGLKRLPQKQPIPEQRRPQRRVENVMKKNSLQRQAAETTPARPEIHR